MIGMGMGQSRHAFTLLELAAVLIIVSLMTGFGLQVFQTTGSIDCYAKTEKQLAEINRALQAFIAANNRLPKPAFPGLGSNDPTFGYEAKGTQTDATQANYGIAGATGVPSGMNNSGGVLFGTIPHIPLGLGIDSAADCWGNKFTYAVTNVLTSSDATSGYPGSLVAGAITLNNNTLASPNLMTANVDYVVISHGMNQMGATPMRAANMTRRHCEGYAGTLIDKENCDVATAGNATFFNSRRNVGSDAVNYFDDLVVFGKKSSNIPNLYCWGTDSSGYGTLADNSLATSYYTPRRAVSGLRFASFAETRQNAVVGAHTCALTSDGTAYCWGNNDRGQLGVGDTTARAIPTAVNTPLKFAKLYTFSVVSGGIDMLTCGLTSDGTAYCWGRNTGIGTVGDGTLINRTTPTAVNTPVKFTMLTGGGTSGLVVCGLATTGDAYCWGNGAIDRADGTTTAIASSPALVTGGRKFVEIFGTRPTCGITSAADAAGAGKIFCWGDAGISGHSMLGLNPIAITGITNANPGVVTAPGHGLTAGDQFIIRYVQGMGAVNSLSSLTNGAGPVTSTAGPFYVTAGNYDANTINLLSSSSSTAFDTRAPWPAYTAMTGQIFVSGKATPTQIANSGGTVFTSFIKSRSENIAAISSSGHVFSWGVNRYNRMGDTSVSNPSSSVELSGFSPPTGVFTSSLAHGFVVDDIVIVTQAVGGVTQLTPNIYYKINTAPSATTFTLKDMNGTAFTTAGWGALTSSGQITKAPASGCTATGGGGQVYCTATPVRPTGLCASEVGGHCTVAGADSVLYSRYNATLVTAGGTMYVWGGGSGGGVGDGTSADRSAPVATVPVYSMQPKLTLSFEGRCGISTGNDAYCWGANTYGNLGDNTIVTRSNPTAVNGGLKFNALTNIGGFGTAGSVMCGLTP